MKNRMIYALSAALAISAMTAVPALAAQGTGEVNASVLNVRSGDSTNDSIIGKLKKGTTVSIEEETENGWYQISYNNAAAYVSGQYITLADAADENAEGADTAEDAVGDTDAAEDNAADENADDTALSEDDTYNNDWDGPVLTKRAGTVQGPSGKETYYNLDMSGVIRIMKNQGYDYDYWVREDGVKMYGDYIMCAANLNVHPRGSLVESSLGTCIVFDTGVFASSNPNQLDIAVTW